jgi:hypothetical protein
VLSENKKKVDGRPADDTSPVNMSVDKMMNVKMVNKNWMAMFDLVKDMPGVTCNTNKELIPGYRIMFQGINKKIEYTQEIQDAFFVLFQTILTMPEDLIDGCSKSKCSILHALVDFNKSLKDIMQHKCEQNLFIGFNFEKNTTGIIISSGECTS